MNTVKLVAAIDDEIRRLNQARKLLSAQGTGTWGGKQTKRTLSPEARQRIADGQRKRWAKAKKATK